MPKIVTIISTFQLHNLSNNATFFMMQVRHPNFFQLSTFLIAISPFPLLRWISVVKFLDSSPRFRPTDIILSISSPRGFPLLSNPKDF